MKKIFNSQPCVPKVALLFASLASFTGGCGSNEAPITKADEQNFKGSSKRPSDLGARIAAEMSANKAPEPTKK